MKSKSLTVNAYLHDVHDSDGIEEAVMSIYHEHGYFMWHRLKCALAKSPGHGLDLSDDFSFTRYQTYLHARDKDELVSFIELLINLRTIDRPAWDSFKVIWMQSFVDDLSGLYANNRKRQPPTLQEFLDNLGLKETPKEPKEVKKKVTLADREQSFKTAVLEYKDRYPMAMLFTNGNPDGLQNTKSFFGYWTERNPSGTKLKFEMNKTFDIGKRLGTWNSNNKQGGQNGKPRQSISGNQRTNTSRLPDRDSYT